MNIPTALPITFVNGCSMRTLGPAVLTALPQHGDFLRLDALAYQIAGWAWHLTRDGQVRIQVMLLPTVNANGKRPFRGHHKGIIRCAR